MLSLKSLILTATCLSASVFASDSIKPPVKFTLDMKHECFEFSQFVDATGKVGLKPVITGSPVSSEGEANGLTFVYLVSDTTRNWMLAVIAEDRSSVCVVGSGADARFSQDLIKLMPVSI